jgi:hypothetical protein
MATSRFLRFTHYLLNHRLIAIVFVFLSTFVPIVGVFGILYAGLVTLRKGIVQGGIMMVAATLPYLISFYFSHGQDLGVSFILWVAVGIAVLSNVLTWVLAAMLQHHMSWSKLLQTTALIGVLFVSIVHLANPNIGDWWGEQLRLYFDKVATLTDMMQSKAVISPDMQMETINATKQYATGLVTMAVLFNALLQLVASRWWQVSLFHPGLLRRELHTIRLSHLAGGLFVLSLVFAYMGNHVVLDMMPILYMLFGAAGLSLVHYLFNLVGSTTKWFWLSLFYMTLIIALPTSVILVGLLGLADVWFDIRKRLKKF